MVKINRSLNVFDPDQQDLESLDIARRSSRKTGSAHKTNSERHSRAKINQGNPGFFLTLIFV